MSNSIKAYLMNEKLVVRYLMFWSRCGQAFAEGCLLHSSYAAAAVS